MRFVDAHPFLYMMLLVVMALILGFVGSYLVAILLTVMQVAKVVVGSLYG